MARKADDAAASAPATVADAGEIRQLSIQIPRFVWLLPLAALVLYLFVSAVSGSRSSNVAPAAPSHVPAAANEPDPTQAVPETAASDDAVEDAQAPSAPEVPPAELDRMVEQAQRAAQQAQRLAEARTRVKVTVYYNDRCSRCTEARAYLTSHGIHAKEQDIDRDPRARARHRRMNRKGSLPTIDIDGKVLAGFDAQRLERAIDRAARNRLRRGR